MYESIKNKLETMSLHDACSALNISRCAYANWLQQPDIKSDNALLDSIRNIVTEFPGYGYRRVTKQLHRESKIVNHKKVLGNMREMGLLCKSKKLFKPKTTDSNHNHRIYPNLAKGFAPTGLNQLWVSDITYIGLLQEFVYLASIMDVFSRKCIGWDLSRNIDAHLTLTALNNALECRKGSNLNGLMHHSDQGVQYACNEYTRLLEERGIKISMARKGNPYDNAFAESFIKTLKAEVIYLNEYETFEDAYRSIDRFIEEVYNQKRLHSSIGYLPPDEFEREILKKIGA